MNTPNYDKIKQIAKNIRTMNFINLEKEVKMGGPIGDGEWDNFVNQNSYFFEQLKYFIKQYLA